MSEDMNGGPFGGKRRGGLFDDIAGVAGGAFSALAGVRAEAEAMARSQVEMLVQRLELVRREELDAAMEVASRARADAEAAREAIAALEARLAALEARNPLQAVSTKAVEPAASPFGAAAQNSSPQERAEESSAGAPASGRAEAPPPRGPVVPAGDDATVSEAGPIEPGTPSPGPGATPMANDAAAARKGKPTG